MQIVGRKRNYNFYYLPSCNTLPLLPSLATLGLASGGGIARQEIIKNNLTIKGYN